MKVNEIILESVTHMRPVNELAPSPGGAGPSDYFRVLASAWYNHDISQLADIARKGGSPMKKIMDAQVAVEKMLQRGVIGSDGKTRKYDISYNSDFDGVVISSADYYEHSDYDAAGNEVDSRSGRPWGPNDYMEFDGDELDEGMYENTELVAEFDLIESIINRLAAHNGVEAEVIWEDLESLTEDELYAFAVTSEPIMEGKGVTEAFGLYGPFTVTINTGERPQSRTKTKKFRREDDAILYAEDWLEDAPQYVFATAKVTDPEGNVVWTTNESLEEQGVAEDWQKANKRDRTAGMSQKAVNAYRRENPGSKLKTAVTTKPSKLKRGSKASKRRKSYCSRSRGQMKMHSISCAKTPDKAICKARRRWNC